MIAFAVADGIVGGMESSGNGPWRAIGRLEESERDMQNRLRLVEQVVATLPDIRTDISDARADCQKIRQWVEEREAEKQRLSAAWWAAIIGGVAIFLSSVIGAIAQLTS